MTIENRRHSNVSSRLY